MPTRHLRRADDDRVLGGVAAGLGHYFALDPVLFRVLFATTAVFGGLGALVYLALWVLMPGAGAVEPLADRVVGVLRDRHVGWVVVMCVAVIALASVDRRPLWGVWPVLIAAGLVAVALSHRTESVMPVEGDSDIDPHERAGHREVTSRVPSVAEKSQSLLRAYRDRRRRSAPMRWGAFGMLVVALGAVATIDALEGLPIVTYGWVMLAVSVGALVVGGIIRRPPWLNLMWAVIAVAIVVAFGGSTVKLRDGSGDRLIAPDSPSALPAEIRAAVGRTTIDLTALSAHAIQGRTVRVTQGVGKVVIDVPRGELVDVAATVRYGSVAIDGDNLRSGLGETTRVARNPKALTIDVHLATGLVEINHLTR